MRLPWTYHLPLERFLLSLAGDDILLAAREPAIARKETAGMEALLELYNLTGKISRHRRTSPWALLVAHPDLFSLLKARLPGDMSTEFGRFLDSGNTDRLLLKSFLHTRVYRIAASDGAAPSPIVVPILDFLNHDLAGARVHLDGAPDADGRLVIARSARVAMAGDECFATYGLFDGFDSWMRYAFIDASAPFVRSVPLDIELPPLGSIRISNYPRMLDRHELPPALQDLDWFVPRSRRERRDRLEASSLLIPGPGRPDALKRALAFLIDELDPGHPRRRDLAARAEAEIIEANRAFYEKLLAGLRAPSLDCGSLHPIQQGFVRMCELELRIIRDYASRMAS